MKLARLAEIFGFKIEAVSGDSAYATEETCRKVIENLKAKPGLKPVARRGKPKRGIYDKFWKMRNLPWMKK